MTDLRQSSAWANYLKSLGWKIEYINKTYIYLKHFPILGWFAKIQRPGVILRYEDIKILESKYHPFQFSVEPSNNNQIKLLSKLNFKQSNSPSLPTKTLIIDLTKSEKEILKSFSQKTRYNTRLSIKKLVTTEKGTNIENFTKFWLQNFERNRFLFLSQKKNIIALHNTFGKNSTTLLAKKNNKTIAALFLLFHDKVAYYMYAAANDEGRKNFAPTLLIWNAILLAKKSGCKTFDFDGIYDERFPIKSWQGFTKFKKGFGGKKTEYPGCFVKTNSIIKI